MIVNFVGFPLDIVRNVSIHDFSMAVLNVKVLATPLCLDVNATKTFRYSFNFAEQLKFVIKPLKFHS